MHQEVTRFLKTALECSIYVEPIEPGLTYAELVEVATRAGFLSGEIHDAIPYAATAYLVRSDDKLLPGKGELIQLSVFMGKEEPDYRNPLAFHFVFQQLRAAARSQGARHAKVERRVLVERGIGERLSRLDVQIAVAILVLNDVLSEKDGIISFAYGKENYGSPGDQSSVQSSVQHPTIRKEARARAYPIVKGVVNRRTDGRSASAEPLDAFAERLDKLGYGAFRMWWVQLVSELRQASAQNLPISVTVLSASLVEGALTFVVKHGRSLGLGMFGSTDFDKPPSSWSIKDLVNSASSSKVDPILDHVVKQRAEGLIQTRQRIHAGRMLTDFPGATRRSARCSKYGRTGCSPCSRMDWKAFILSLRLDHQESELVKELSFTNSVGLPRLVSNKIRCRGI